MITIQNTLKVNSLFLTWQSNESQKNRYFVGVVSKDGDTYNLRYLINTAEFKRAEEAGFQGYPAFKVNDKTYTNNVMTTFMKRLPPRSRRDFSKYLNQHHLSNDFSGSDFELISHTGIQLPSDGFDLIPDLSEAEIPFDYMMEVAGTRHNITYEQFQTIKLKDEAILQLEDDNQFDCNAIAVYISGIRVGYVNKILCSSIKELLNRKCIQTIVSKKSGTTARPLLYLMLSAK
jgi:hypothetical protein